MLNTFQPRFSLKGSLTAYKVVFPDDVLFPLDPLGVNGERENRGFKAESERCFVLKANGYAIKTRLDRDFYTFNGFAFDFGEVLLCCVHRQPSIYQECINCPIGQSGYGILRLMLKACPQIFVRGLVSGFGNSGKKRASCSAISRK